MKRSYLLLAAYLFDLAAGDPEWLPHPVRLMGLAITRGECVLRCAEDDPSSELLAGAVLTVGLVATSFYGTRALVRWAYRQSKRLGQATEILLAWTSLSLQNLQLEAMAVFDALQQEDLPEARGRVARIVGRDTERLDAAEISRALIETLAESVSDGVIAPIFYLAVGGAPLAMAYKAVNTLDSMIGHRNRQYLYFGKFAARLDDAANYLPSRLTAMSTVAAAAMPAYANAHHAWRTWLRDGSKHKSPNAGQTEAAMSGALGVRLGGDNRYAGELIATPHLGEEFPLATPAKARQAIRLTTTIAFIGLAVGGLLTMARRSEV